MTLSNIEPEDLIADPSVRAQRFLDEYAVTLQKTAANMWRWGPDRYPADRTAAMYARARRATWRACGWPESEAP